MRLCHNLVHSIILYSQRFFLLTLVQTMATQAERVMARTIRLLGKYNSVHPSVGLIALRIYRKTG